MAASKGALRIMAFQQAMHPAVLSHVRPAPQQDALALRTLDERHIQQTPLGQWACETPGNMAWVSVADGVSSSPCADLASRSFLAVLHDTSPTTARQLPSLAPVAQPAHWLACW